MFIWNVWWWYSQIISNNKVRVLVVNSAKFQCEMIWSPWIRRTRVLWAQRSHPTVQTGTRKTNRPLTSNIFLSLPHRSNPHKTLQRWMRKTFTKVVPVSCPFHKWLKLGLWSSQNSLLLRVSIEFLHSHPHFHLKAFKSIISSWGKFFDFVFLMFRISLKRS
jgi:hypothetical protein